MELSSFASIESIYSDTSLKMVSQKEGCDIDLKTLFAEKKNEIKNLLTKYGGVFFRGFDISSQSDFKGVVEAIIPELSTYMNQSTPRTNMGNNIYTATEYPCNQTISMHNENAYCNNWPRVLAFFCETPPVTGGETPLADSRKIFSKIPIEIANAFRDKKIMYTRTYGLGIDLPWETVFQTKNKEEVSRYCSKVGIQVAWDGDILRVKEICPACLQHPITKEWVWFNQAHLFHVSNLDEDIREYLLGEYGEESLPRNAYFGDGTTIPSDYLDEIRKVIDKEKRKTPWESGDLLLLDNLLYAHGREPFTGDRKILVAMGN